MKEKNNDRHTMEELGEFKPGDILHTGIDNHGISSVKSVERNGVIYGKQDELLKNENENTRSLDSATGKKEKRKKHKSR